MDLWLSMVWDGKLWFSHREKNIGILNSKIVNIENGELPSGKKYLIIKRGFIRKGKLWFLPRKCFFVLFSLAYNKHFHISL